MKKILVLFTLCLLLIVVGCDSSKTPHLGFSSLELVVNVGEEFTLEPIIRENDGKEEVIYAFDTEGIIENLQGNTFKTLSEGSVKIIAKLKNNETVTCEVNVTVISDEADKYIVTFIGFEDVVLKTEEVEKGDKATAPTAPSIEGYTFKGWDKAFDNITSNLEVKALYEKVVIEVYVVKFLDKDGNILKTEEVEKGDKATAPTAPSIEGYTFKGWDKTFDNVTSNLEVKALYEKEVTVMATEIELKNEFSVFKVNVGDTIKLEWKVLPAGASQVLDIYSEDNSVAIASDDGVISIVGEGNTYIVLETTDGSKVSRKVEIYAGLSLEDDEEAPVFVLASGSTDKIRLNWNTSFNPLADVSAKDNVDGDLTSEIEVIHNVDNRTYGTYDVTYKVSDKAGNVTEMKRTVEVVWDYAVEFIGHAGSYYGAMNSEEAILYAITKLKYTCVEIDLKSTKDGVFVLSHDDTFGGISIASTNWADLKDVEISSSRTAGYPFQNGEAPGNGKYTAKLCTLDRFLEICKQYGTKAVIELKGSPGITNSDQSKMPALMTAIKNKGMLDQVIFLASAYNCLIWTRNNGYSDIPCQYLVSSIENETYLKRCIDYKLDISTNTTYGGSNSDEWIARYKEAGIKISTYTYTQYVDYPEVQKWIDKGVDFVTCDWHSMDKLKLPVKVDESLLPTYTVTFKDYNGTVLKTVSVKEGKTAVAPSNPSRTGYEFTGWDKAITNVKSDLVVTAKYDKLTYTIKYVNTLSSVTVEEWANKEAFGAEFYSDYYNWLLTKAGILNGITKNGNTITIKKNGKTVSFSSAADILNIDIYDFELTLSNYIYKPVTRLSDGTCVIEPSEDYFLNSDAYREKYKEVDALLMRGIKGSYTWYDDTYTPTSAGKIQIFFRFHQWLQGTNISVFLPLPKKYIVSDSGIDVTMPTTPSIYDVDSEITLPTPTSTLEFLGWYTNANFTGSPISKISKGSTGNLVLYAKWKTE